MSYLCSVGSLDTDVIKNKDLSHLFFSFHRTVLLTVQAVYTADISKITYFFKH